MRGLKDEIWDCFPRNERGIAIPLNIDFDGTVIYHGYDLDSNEFKINGKSIETLKRWVSDYNCAINIYTTRCGKKLNEVVSLFQENGIPFASVGGNEQQNRWTSGRKEYGFVIDDMSATKVFYDENGRATVDWDFLVDTFEPRLVDMKNIIDKLQNEHTKEEIFQYCTIGEIIND